VERGKEKWKRALFPDRVLAYAIIEILPANLTRFTKTPKMSIFRDPGESLAKKNEPDEAEQPNQQGEKELATPVQPRGKRHPAVLFPSQANCPASVSDSFD
jgi:hypothetical protein